MNSIQKEAKKEAVKKIVDIFEEFIEAIIRDQNSHDINTAIVRMDVKDDLIEILSNYPMM